jgi:hypothetical protein
MTKVQLTQELVKELFDYRDGFLYWKINRGKRSIGDLAGYILTDLEGYKRRRITVNSKTILAARLIFLWHKGYLPENVDHINHDTLDDRIEYLRGATGNDNSKNRSSVKGSASKYLGVSFTKANLKWKATIRHNWNRHFLGYFKNESDAALAYNKAAVRLHKEFANLNIIQPQ